MRGVLHSVDAICVSDIPGEVMVWSSVCLDVAMTSAMFIPVVKASTLCSVDPNVVPLGAEPCTAVIEVSLDPDCD